MKKTLAVLFAALLLFAAACGSDDDDESTAGDDTRTDEPTGGGDDTGTDQPSGDDGECPFISTTDVSSAVGGDVTEEIGADGTCLFSTDDGRTFSFDLLQIALDPVEYAEQAKASCDDGTVEDVDVADAAYACVAFGPFGAVYDGDQSVSIGVTGSSDEEADVAVVAELLTHVTI